LVLADVHADSYQESWDGDATLERDKVNLFWRTTKDYITLRLEVKSRSWIGLGWNPGPGAGKMTNADMVILSKIGAELKLLDYWSAGYEMPMRDERDNLDDCSFGLKDDGNVVWFQFTRAWDSHDNMDKPIQAYSNEILWAYGSENEYSLSYHGSNRGHAYLLFADGHQEVSHHHHHHGTEHEEHSHNYDHSHSKNKEHKYDEYYYDDDDDDDDHYDHYGDYYNHNRDYDDYYDDDDDDYYYNDHDDNYDDHYGDYYDDHYGDYYDDYYGDDDDYNHDYHDHYDHYYDDYDSRSSYNKKSHNYNDGHSRKYRANKHS
jgi:hypothetical protein